MVRTSLMISFFVVAIALQILNLWLQVQSISARSEALRLCEETHKVKCEMSAVPKKGV